VVDEDLLPLQVVYACCITPFEGLFTDESTIELATTSGRDPARGLGARDGYKPYPFVQKVPVTVEIRVPSYAVIGNIHCNSWNEIWRVFEKGQLFLPVTDASMRPLVNDAWWNVPFVAVNREQILLLKKGEVP